jgi:hypothetical protein
MFFIEVMKGLPMTQHSQRVVSRRLGAFGTVRLSSVKACFRIAGGRAAVTMEDEWTHCLDAPSIRQTIASAISK